MADCENIASCSFFAKYKDAKKLACQGLMATYCQGTHQGECKRKEYKRCNGASPDADMLPNGGRINV